MTSGMGTLEHGSWTGPRASPTPGFKGKVMASETQPHSGPGSVSFLVPGLHCPRTLVVAAAPPQGPDHLPEKPEGEGFFIKIHLTLG